MAKDTVLVLSASDDPTAAAVMNEFSGAVPVVRMDLGDFPQRMNFAAELARGTWRCALDDGTTVVELSRVRSVYYQRPSRFRFPGEMSKGDREFADAEARRGFGGILAGLDVRWVNNPTRAALAEYKPMQLQVASRCGLAVPDSIITNDHDAVLDFAARLKRPVVCKTLGSVILGEDGSPRVTYTTPVDPATIDAGSLGVTAHLIQEWVPKKYDVRVTVVGRVPFAAAIHADSEAARIDWRADYDSLAYERIAVPDTVTAGIIRYLDAFQLSFGAFDFVVTPEGEWVMLECNPSGQWLWLQEAAGLPIAEALADLLVGKVT